MAGTKSLGVTCTVCTRQARWQWQEVKQIAPDDFAQITCIQTNFCRGTPINIYDGPPVTAVGEDGPVQTRLATVYGSFLSSPANALEQPSYLLSRFLIPINRNQPTSTAIRNAPHLHAGQA